MIYVILGGPATGKGTRSEILSNKLNIPHISTGEILRESAKQNKEINDMLSNGMLISDDIINELLYKRVKKDDCKNGFILDGYPRKIEQVYALEAMVRKLNMEIKEVIELVASKELVFKRVLQRKECPKCNKVFGIDFPSKKGDYCDVCDAKLVTRTDDTEETLAKRISTYEKLSKPVLEYYTKKNMLVIVDSSGHPEQILKFI